MPTYSHGVASFIGAGGAQFGLRQSFTSAKSHTVDQAYDASGNTAAVKSRDGVSTFGMQVVVDAAATFLGVGSTISVTDSGTAVNAMLDSVSKSEQNQGYKTADLSARRWTTNGLPT